MSLLASTKFWETRMRLRQRLCYLSGLLLLPRTRRCSPSSAPLVPIVLLLALPGRCHGRTTCVILPSIVYNLVVFPLWHRAPYRLEAWTVQDDVRLGARLRDLGHPARAARWAGSPPARQGGQEEQAPGGSGLGVMAWSGGTALLWVGVAVCRIFTMYPPDFALVLSAPGCSTRGRRPRADPAQGTPRRGTAAGASDRG